MTKTYDYQHLVTFGETNLVGNVYFTNYLAWQGACREHFLIDHAPAVIQSLRAGLALVTTSCGCDFFDELYAADTVELRMSLGEISNNRISMAFDYYRLRHTMSQLVARGRQTIACMRRTASGMEPVPVPSELAAALETFSS